MGWLLKRDFHRILCAEKYLLHDMCKKNAIALPGEGLATPT